MLSNGTPLRVRERTSEDLNWIELEDDVQFTPSGDPNNASRYRAGDYWLIPARVVTGDVLWPKESQGGRQVAKALPPHGMDHHYAAHCGGLE